MHMHIHIYIYIQYMYNVIPCVSATFVCDPGLARAAKCPANHETLTRIIPSQAAPLDEVRMGYWYV